MLFVPDQHLGRNTALAMGYPPTEMKVWNPRFEQGGLEDREIKDSRFLLWKGHCSVHQRFTPLHVAAARAEHPGVRIIVHPECAHEVVALADKVGSTERILDLGRRSPGRFGAGHRHRDPHGASAWPPPTPTRRSSPSTP